MPSFNAPCAVWTEYLPTGKTSPPISPIALRLQLITVHVPPCEVLLSGAHLHREYPELHHTFCRHQRLIRGQLVQRLAATLDPTTIPQLCRSVEALLVDRPPDPLRHPGLQLIVDQGVLAHREEEGTGQPAIRETGQE